MKNLKRLTFVIVLIALLLGMATVVNAESAIVVTLEKTVSGDTAGSGHQRDVVFANGNAITITACTEGDAGADIVWEGSEGHIHVGPDALIFGGSHSDAISTINETSITMEGGKIGAIIGGSLHAGTVKTANVVVNGGTITGGIYGGGAAYMVNVECTNRTTHATPAISDVKDATAIVEEANVTVNGGNIIGTVFGGGESMAYTKVANVNINGGTIGAVSGSGSNGFMDEVNINVTDGDITVLQTINRGTLGSATVSATGGTIGTLSVTGHDQDTSTGVVKAVSIDLDGDVVVNTLEEGKSISSIEDDEDDNKLLSISMLESSVKTNNLTEPNKKAYQEVKTVTITVGTQKYEVAKGTTVELLNDEEDVVITAMKTYIALTGEDLEYVLVDDEGNTYGLEDALVADVELKVAVKEPDAEDPGTTEPLPGDDQPGSDVPGTDEPGTTEPEPDNGNGGTTANPNTGDNVVVYSVVGLVGLAVVAISLVRKNELSK